MSRATDPHDEARRAIAQALRDLELALDRFVQALAHDVGPASTEDGRSDAAARRRICEACATIDYAQDDAVNQTPTCLGIAGVTAAVIDYAQAVNEAKARLRSVCAPLQNRRVRAPVKDGRGGRVVKTMPLVRLLLRELQRSDLNLLAAYRRIPVLTGRVARVAYLRARTRAVYRKSRAEIEALLGGLDRPGVAADRARLAGLPARETHLALVRERYANVRANVWFDGLDRRNRGRAQIAAELPLLYPLGRSRDLPEIVYPADVDIGNDAVRRRTGKLEDTSFLQSLPVYRYRPDRRPAGRR